MKRPAFADLIGVSPQMVTKYVQAGLIVLDVDGRVEVDVSLSNLQGRLRPERLQRALAAREAASPTPPPPVSISPKLHKDAIERDLKLVQLGRETRELVLAQEVEDAGRRAVQALRDSAAASRRETAQRLCVTFGIAPDRAPALVEALRVEFEVGMAAFAREMQREEAEALTRNGLHAAQAGPAASAGRLL